MLRLLITLAIVVAVIAYLRRRRARAKHNERPPALDARTVRCAHCAVYFPEREAVRRDGMVYCTRAHADAATLSK
jgi:uncharacterized protein